MFNDLTNFYQFSDAVEYCSNYDSYCNISKKKRRKYHRRPSLWKPIAVGRKYYQSITDAAKANDITEALMHFRVNSKHIRYVQYRYITKEEYTKEHLKNIERVKSTRKPITINDTYYSSIQEAVNSTNMTRRVITYRINSTLPKWSQYKWAELNKIIKKKVNTLKIKEPKISRIDYLRSNDLDYMKDKVFKNGRNFKYKNIGNIQEDGFGRLYIQYKTKNLAGQTVNKILKYE